jgi:predicted RNase H-like HicB family nuclease
MTVTRRLTALIEREGNGYVSLCPELDVASQGDTVEDALANLKEAVELFMETASPSEINNRLHDEVFVTHLEVAVG